MRMSVANLEAIRAWAIRNQGAVPELTLRLTFATDIARSVIEQDAAPDPQRVIEIGFDIGNLMWRIRSYCSGMTRASGDRRAGPTAATRVIREAIRRGLTETRGIAEFVDGQLGKIVEVVEVIDHDESLDMPEFGFRPIAVNRQGDVYTFADVSDEPCRPSRIRSLPSSIGKARRGA